MATPKLVSISHGSDNLPDSRSGQPPPQALRFSHGGGERETSDW